MNMLAQITGNPFFTVTLPLVIALLIAAWNSNKRMDDMSRRLDDFVRRLNAIEKRLERIEGRLESFAERITNLEARTWGTHR